MDDIAGQGRPSDDSQGSSNGTNPIKKAQAGSEAPSACFCGKSLATRPSWGNEDATMDGSDSGAAAVEVCALCQQILCRLTLCRKCSYNQLNQSTGVCVMCRHLLEEEQCLTHEMPKYVAFSHSMWSRITTCDQYNCRRNLLGKLVIKQ